MPIGAVVVCDGVIIGEGWNVRETEQNVCGHAELLALRSACRHLGSWRLDNCDLYVTLEPCIMCAGAIQNARLRNLFFGAYDPKAGACGSRWDILSLPGLNHDVFVQGGLMREECARLIHSFFVIFARKTSELNSGKADAGRDASSPRRTKSSSIRTKIKSPTNLVVFQWRVNVAQTK